MIDLMALADDRPRDRGHLHPQGARLGGSGRRAEGRLIDAGRLLPVLPRDRWPRTRGNGTARRHTATAGGNGHAHGDGHGGASAGHAHRSLSAGDRDAAAIIDPDRSGCAGTTRCFLSLAAVMLVAGLLVVTMRDIIRCGLAMIVCFAALAGIYVLLGAPLVAAAQVIVVHRRDQRPDPVRDHAHPDQGGAARLVFQTQAGWRASLSIVLGHHRSLIAVTATAVARAPATGPTRDERRSPRTAVRATTCCRSRSVGVLLLAAVDRRRVPRQARGGGRLMPRPPRPRQSLDTLPRSSSGAAVRDRDVRVPRPPQRDQHADVDRADAQRRQPRRSSPSARSSRRSRAHGVGHRADGHRRSRRPRRPSASRSSSRSSATGRRRSSTSTTRCANEPAADATDRLLDPAHPRPAAGGLRVHRARRAAARRPAGALDPGPAPSSSRGSIAMVVVVNVLSGGAVAPFGEHGYGFTIWRVDPGRQRSSVEVGFFVDNLTAALLIVVTTIGMLVHVYSIGYMSHDPGYWRFFAYLNLFMFSMLAAGPRRQLAGRVRRLGAGRPVQLPADRVLVPQALGARRPPRRRSSSTASATSGSRSGSWPSSSNTGDARTSATSLERARRPGPARPSIPTGDRRAARVRRRRWARAPSSRCTSGCPTRWRARRRSPR